MMKLVGILCMMTGCFGLAFNFYTEMNHRYQTLNYFRKILHAMEQELTYSRATLPQICHTLAKQLREPYAGMMEQIYTEGEQERERSFSDIWRRKITEISKNASLKTSDTEILAGIFDSSRNGSLEMQKRALLLARDNLESECERLHREKEGKGKVILCLGITGGLVISILFL